MELPNLIAGMLDQGVELFGMDMSSALEVACIYDSQIFTCWTNIPAWIKMKVSEHRIENPEIAKKVEKKAFDFGGDAIMKYAYYAFGRLNGTPDIAVDGTMNHEFHVCLNNGVPLSDTEANLLKEVVRPDKEISDTKFISKHTVNTHFQTIRSKTGCKNRAELTLAAAKEGLI